MNDTVQQSGARVLLVDDDRLVLATMQMGLKNLGYQVEVADSGETALEQYQADTPEIVVMDFRMPGMTGVEAASAMLAVAYRPIIMLSAYNDQELVRQAVKTGVASYLVKPIEPKQLAPSIEAALARFSEVNALLNNEADLREGLERSRLISTAVGIVMERSGLSSDVAFDRLRRLARDQRRPLRELAQELVTAVTMANTILSSFRD